MTYHMGYRNAAALDYAMFGGAEISDADWIIERDEMRRAHRTNRLMNLIEVVEERIECADADDAGLPELRERLANLTRALLNHRKI